MTITFESRSSALPSVRGLTEGNTALTEGNADDLDSKVIVMGFWVFAFLVFLKIP
jgi:hypothetical protein